VTARTIPDVETLHQAAAEIRDDVNVATRSVRPFLIAVADFLQESGDDLAEAAGNYEWCNGNTIRAALIIARAYLGEAVSGA
jgi:hypothetical protein